MPIIKHRYYDRPEYRAWQRMKSRCCNKRDVSYPNYGARGIKVCDRWLESFVNFIDDMGDRPSESHTLDRIDNDGNYEPSNCRWATQEQQMNNRSDSKFIEYDGKTMTVSQWDRYLGFPPGKIATRLKRGWTIERAFTQPVDSSLREHNVFLEHDNKKMTMSQWSRHIGIPLYVIKNRIKMGWTVERTLTQPVRTLT